MREDTASAQEPHTLLRVYRVPFIRFPLSWSVLSQQGWLKVMDKVSMTMNRWLVLGWAFFTMGAARAADGAGGLRSPELAAQPQAVTTAEQRQQILATIRALERSAFSVGASTAR